MLWLFYRLATVADLKYKSDTVANLKQNSYNHLIEHSYSFFANSFEIIYKKLLQKQYKKI